MRHIRLALAVAVCLAVVGMTETRVQAQIFDGGYLSGWYPYWFGGPAYQSSMVPTPPYFAIHPPVYYGGRVGMPYGNSPITRPPRQIVAERALSSESVPAPVGQWIDNPFYEKPRATEQAPSRQERKRRVPTAVEAPVATENPYFVADQP